MKLFGSYTSPYVRHCRIALLETGLDCDFVEADAAAGGLATPTRRVPYLEDQAITLTDSSSILKHLREKAGQNFFPDLVDYDLFCLVNTALDATVNLFMLEKDDLTPEKSVYLKRQSQRVESVLEQLNRTPLPMRAPYTDAHLRLACYLAWGLFRRRIHLEPYRNLRIFLDGANSYEQFRVTAPPQP